MDIHALIKTLQKSTTQIIESYCIINGDLMNLDEVQDMGYDEFKVRSRINMPLKLYKYFSNRTVEVVDEHTGAVNRVNYSIQSLKDNTVFMQAPSLFDDVYDSDINLNYNEYEKIRLFQYCKRCGLNVTNTMTTQELGDELSREILKSFNENGNVDSIFKIHPTSKSEELSNIKFILNLKNELIKDSNVGIALSRAIYSDFYDYVNFLQNTFRATCFATTPYSQLMWGGSYGDCHKGFCVEYTVLPNDPNYEEILSNIFPMIYCKIRPNMTEKLLKFQDQEPTEELLWDIYYHGALRKSIDWAFQNEWRLLLPMDSKLESKKYCIPFFPITKVYLGNRMAPMDRKEVIDICNTRNIPYIGVTRKPDVFEMQDCTIKCELCPNYNKNVSK